MNFDKKILNKTGFRALHTDFINNDESQGYRVVFDNAPNIAIPKRQLTESAFIRELATNSNIELI